MQLLILTILLKIRLYQDFKLVNNMTNIFILENDTCFNHFHLKLPLKVISSCKLGLYGCGDIGIYSRVASKVKFSVI